MCLYIKSGHRKVYRAGYDILVFKRLCSAGSGLRSPYQRKWYKLGRLYKHKRAFKVCGGTQVYHGLHSYYRPPSCIRSWYGKQLYPAIIPKGSLFIIGIYGEVVSNALLVHGQRYLDSKPLGVADFSQHTVVSRF
jgi:hypothetical protein